MNPNDLASKKRSLEKAGKAAGSPAACEGGVSLARSVSIGYIRGDEQAEPSNDASCGSNHG
jgi:hypothetical protein